MRRPCLAGSRRSQVAPERPLAACGELGKLAGALGTGQLDPNAFSAAVNRVTALRAGLF